MWDCKETVLNASEEPLVMLDSVNI